MKAQESPPPRYLQNKPGLVAHSLIIPALRRQEDQELYSKILGVRFSAPFFSQEI